MLGLPLKALLALIVLISSSKASTLTCFEAILNSAGPLTAENVVTALLADGETLSRGTLNIEEYGPWGQVYVPLSGTILTTSRGYKYVFELPTLHKPTAWSLLPETERLNLFQRLLSLFQAAIYEKEGKQLGLLPEVRPENLTLIMRGLLRSPPATDPKNRIQYPHEATQGNFGVSPIMMLWRASQPDHSCGLCEDANTSMMGLLVKVGIPLSDLRLVVGDLPFSEERLFSPFKESSRHMWVEMRLSPASDWLEGDATPRQRSVQARKDADDILNANLPEDVPELMRKFLSSLRANRQFRAYLLNESNEPEPSNRSQYPLIIKEIYFLPTI